MFISPEQMVARSGAEERAQADRMQTKDVMDKYLTNPGAGFAVSGNADQQREVATGLSQVGAMTGQNIMQVGQQQQDYYNSLQNRRNGGDAVANHLLNQRNRNMANIARGNAGRKVAGGVAAAGMNSAQAEADSSVGAQMQTNSRQNDLDLWNYVKRNQKVTGEALASGQDRGLAQSMDTSQAEGVFGTVICTELYRQGLMSHELYLKDVTFGMKLEKADPHAIHGYRLLAGPVVRKMKKSKLFTKLVSIPALAWAKYMAGEKNLLGAIIMKTGIPLCRIVFNLSYVCDKCSYGQPCGEKNV